MRFESQWHFIIFHRANRLWVQQHVGLLTFDQQRWKSNDIKINDLSIIIKCHWVTIRDFHELSSLLRSEYCNMNTMKAVNALKGANMEQQTGNKNETKKTIAANLPFHKHPRAHIHHAQAHTHRLQWPLEQSGQLEKKYYRYG